MAELFSFGLIVNIKLQKISIFCIVLTCLIFFISCTPKFDKKYDTKFDSLNSISEKWLKSNCDSAMVYALKLKAYSENSNIADQKFRAFSMQGRIFETIGQHDSAMICFKAMLNIATHTKDTSRILEAYNRVYISFSNLSESDSSSKYLQKGRQLSSLKGDTIMLAVFESALGQFFQDNEMNDSANFHFIRAARYFESVNDSSNLALSYRNIGNSLKRLDFLNEAGKYYKKALHLQLKLNNLVETGLDLNNLATIYKALDQDSARIYFLWAMKVLENTKSIESQLMVRFNYANFLKSKNKYDDAMSLYKEVYDMSLENNIIKGQLLSLNLMAKTSSVLNKNKEAQEYFRQAIEIAIKKKSNIDLKRLYREVFEFNLGIGDIEKAREFFGKWEVLSDSLNSAEQKESIIRYQTLYETEKKEKENSELRNNIQIKARNNIIFMSFGLGLFLIMIFLIYVSRQRNKYLKLAISRAQLKIEQYDNEAKTKAYAKVDNTKENEIAKAIHRILVDEKLYMNTQLTLEMLADEAKTNRKTLSQTINSSYGMNFNSLINFYRVEAAKKLLVDPLYKNHKMEAIGFKAGFNTRQNFYLAFNKYVGLSPAEYQQKNN